MIHDSGKKALKPPKKDACSHGESVCRSDSDTFCHRSGGIVRMVCQRTQHKRQMGFPGGNPTPFFICLQPKRGFQDGRKGSPLLNHWGVLPAVGLIPVVDWFVAPHAFCSFGWTHNQKKEHAGLQC